MFSRKTPSCPSCDSRDVRAAHFRDIKDYVLLLAGRRPFRCRECHFRFHDWVLRRRAPGPPEKRHYRPRQLRVRISNPPEALRRFMNAAEPRPRTEEVPAATVPDH